MIRHYQATAIDCDTCDEVYVADVCEVDAAVTTHCAKHAGWKMIDVDGPAKHQCPACVKSGKRLEVAAEA